MEKDQHLKNQTIYITNSAYDELYTTTDNLSESDNHEETQNKK